MNKFEPRFTVDTEGRTADHLESIERRLREERFHAEYKAASEKFNQEIARQFNTEAVERVSYKGGNVAFRLASLVLLLAYVCWSV